MKKLIFDKCDGKINIKEIALWYHLKFGFNVLPLKGKAPSNVWTKWQNQKQIKSDVENFNWNNITNIGAISGIDNLIILDFDKVKNPHIITEFKISLGLPDDYSWIIKSGSGFGWHIWVRVVDIVELDKLLGGKKSNYKLSMISDWCDHIDLRRMNCQTVLPPSIHISGKQYLFAGKFPKEKPMQIESEVLMDTLKDYCKIMIYGSTKKEPPNASGLKRTSLSEEEKEKILNAINQISKHNIGYDDWYRCCFAFTSIGEEGRPLFIKMSLDNPYYKDTEEEINKKFDSLLKDYNGEITLGTLYAIADKYNKQDNPPTVLISARQLQKMKIPDINWIVEGLLPEGLVILAGRPKIGKSWMALDIALAVSMGNNALKYFKANKSSVIYIPYEDNTRRLQSRLNMIMGSGNQLAPSNLYYPEDNFNFPKLNETGVEKIQNLLDDKPDIKLVIIDTLGRGIADKGRKDKSIYNADYELTSRLQKMAISRNICVLIIHHTRKEKTENVFDQISGSTGITAGVDTMLVLREKNKEHLLHVVGRDVMESEFSIEFDDATCVWRVSEKVPELKMTAERKEIYELIKSNGCEMRSGKIAETLGKTKSNISKMLDKMYSEGLIVRVKYGVYDLSEDVKGINKISEQLRGQKYFRTEKKKPEALPLSTTDEELWFGKKTEKSG